MYVRHFARHQAVRIQQTQKPKVFSYITAQPAPAEGMRTLSLGDTGCLENGNNTATKATCKRMKNICLLVHSRYSRFSAVKSSKTSIALINFFVPILPGKP